MLRSSFSLAWLAEDLSRWKKNVALSLFQTEDLRPQAGGGVYRKKGVGRVQNEDSSER